MRGLALVGVVLFSSLLLAGCNPLTAKQKAGLQVITHDGASSLFLDGEYLDKSPYINKEIKPGTYSLRIQPDDPELVPYETSVTLRKGVLTVVTWKAAAEIELSGGVIYEMEALPARGETQLAFVTVPDNAIIKLDNRTEALFSPTVVSDLDPGQHEFEVSLPSFESQRHTINIVKGYKVTATVKLAKKALTEAPPTSTTTLTASASAQPRSATSSSSSASRRPAINGPAIKILSTNFFSNGKEVLRVREGASNSTKELGMAEVGSSYLFLNETSNGWHKIEFEGRPGWVSTQFSEQIL